MFQEIWGLSSFWEMHCWQLKLCTTCLVSLMICTVVACMQCLFVFVQSLENLCLHILQICTWHGYCRYTFQAGIPSQSLGRELEFCTTMTSWLQRGKKDGSLGCRPPATMQSWPPRWHYMFRLQPRPTNQPYMMFTYFYHQAGLLHFCGLFLCFSPVCICGNGRKA